MLNAIKCKVHVYLFLAKFSFGYVLNLFSFIIGLIILLIEPPIGVITIILSFVPGLVAFTKDTMEIHNKKQDLYIIDSDHKRLLTLKMSDTYEGHFEFLDFSVYRALYDREVNRLLRSGHHINFQMSKQFYKRDKLVDIIAPTAIKNHNNSRIFNDRKIRIITDITSDAIKNDKPIVIQPTNYFSSVCTNEMTCHMVRSSESGNIVYDGYKFMSNNEIILDLNQSLCSNHIGVSTVAFTNDGFLLYMVQSNKADQTPRRLMPTSSGSLDHSDYINSPTSFLALGMKRELIEEWNLDSMSKQVRDADFLHTVIVGYARYLNRGGKPEFFGVSFIDMTFAELKQLRKKDIFIADGIGLRVDRDKEDLLACLKQFVNKNEDKMSLSFYVNLLFIIQFLEEDPDLFFKLIPMKK